MGRQIVQCLGTVGLYFSFIWLVCWSEQLVQLAKSRSVVTPCSQPGFVLCSHPLWTLGQVLRTQDILKLPLLCDTAPWAGFILWNNKGVLLLGAF